jgi:predicted component of viral defense system (DUF524 family)
MAWVCVTNIDGGQESRINIANIVGIVPAIDKEDTLTIYTTGGTIHFEGITVTELWEKIKEALDDDLQQYFKTYADAHARRTEDLKFPETQQWL